MQNFPNKHDTTTEFLPNREIFLRGRLKELFKKLEVLKNEFFRNRKNTNHPFYVLHASERRQMCAKISHMAYNGGLRLDKFKLKEIFRYLKFVSYMIEKIAEDLPEMDSEVSVLMKEVTRNYEVKLRAVGFPEAEADILIDKFRMRIFTLSDDLKKHNQVYREMYTNPSELYERLMEKDGLEEVRKKRAQFYAKLRKKAQNADPS